MKKLKTYTKHVFLVVALIFTAISCQKDDELKNDETNLEKIDVPIKSQKIDFINSQHHARLSERLSTINQKLETFRLSSRLGTNDLTIILEDVLYTEYDNTHTYTFKILREQPLVYVENLVLHYNIYSQNYDEYLVQYHITGDEFLGLGNGEQFQSSENVTITTLEQGYFESNTFNRSCERVCTNIFVTCEWGVHDGSNIADWVACQSYGTDGGPSVYQSCTSSCPNIDAGGSGGGGGNGSGSGGGGSSGSGVVITKPNANEPCVSGRGTVGIVGNDGCITTADEEARNQLFDRLVSYMTSQQQADWIYDANFDVVNAFNDFLDESNIFNQTQYHNFSIELITVIMFDSQIDINALQFTFEAFNQDKIYNNFDHAFLSSVNQYMAIDTSDESLTDPIAIHILMKMALIRALNPDICAGLSEWRCDVKVFWEATKDVVHIVLDGIGLVPVVGEVADLINGGLYLLEGDGVNATLSFAATVPIAGWTATGTKYAIKIVDASQTASVIATKVQLTWKVVGNAIDWGSNDYCRKQLRKVLNLTNPTIHAHHLIPLNFKNNPIVQKAAKSGNAFHINEELNGFPIPSSTHLTGHNLYNNKIESILNYLQFTNPNMTPNQAYNHIQALNTQIKSHLINNPSFNLGQISNLIIYP